MNLFRYLVKDPLMKSTGIITILLLLLSIGCKKQDVAKGTPRCVQNKIEEFAKTSCTDGVQVDKYKFQGKEVYVFEPGNCGADMTSEVIDSDCKTLGYLGGFAGNTKINGEEFSNATFIKTVWKK